MEKELVNLKKKLKESKSIFLEKQKESDRKAPQISEI